MFMLCLPRPRGRAVGASAIGVMMAAFLFAIPAICEGGVDAASQSAVVPSIKDAVRDGEQDALLARAQSLEALGLYLWTNNLSESRARQRAFELRSVARLLYDDAKLDVGNAETDEEQTVAQRRLEVVGETSTILEDVADKISKTRGTRRKIRILALELSRQAWTVVRNNNLQISDEDPVVPGQLFKDNQLPADPSMKAALREPRKDYLTYMRGALDTDVLELRFYERTPRCVRSVPEEDLYYNQGALTLSPLDDSYRSKRIWWSPPAEELAWVVEQW